MNRNSLWEKSYCNNFRFRAPNGSMDCDWCCLDASAKKKHHFWCDRSRWKISIKQEKKDDQRMTVDDQLILQEVGVVYFLSKSLRKLDRDHFLSLLLFNSLLVSSTHLSFLLGKKGSRAITFSSTVVKEPRSAASLALDRPSHELNVERMPSISFNILKSVYYK